MENGRPVEAQQVVKNIVSGKGADQVNNGIAQNDVKHEIWDALVPVHIAIPLEITAQIFQWGQLLRCLRLFYQQCTGLSMKELLILRDFLQRP